MSIHSVQLPLWWCNDDIEWCNGSSARCWSTTACQSTMMFTSFSLTWLNKQENSRKVLFSLPPCDYIINSFKHWESLCCLYCRRYTWHWYSCTLCSERLEHVRTFLSSLSPSNSLPFISQYIFAIPRSIVLVFLQGSHHILHPPPWTALSAQSHISRDCKRVGGRLWYGKQPTQCNYLTQTDWSFELHSVVFRNH